MVIVAVSPVVAPAPKLIAPLLVSAKLGGAVTVTLTKVFEVILPVAASFPVTVTT
jgi:membrane glycosyltransferase